MPTLPNAFSYRISVSPRPQRATGPDSRRQTEATRKCKCNRPTTSTTTTNATEDGFLLRQPTGRRVLFRTYRVQWPTIMHGPFSSALLYLPFLQVLHVHRTELHPGPLPRSLGRSLHDLDLSSTQFTGTIPSFRADLLTIYGSIHRTIESADRFWCRANTVARAI
jgi:hypothetical protein